MTSHCVHSCNLSLNKGNILLKIILCILTASSPAACSTRCIEQKSCQAALFNETDLKCTLHKSAMVNERRSSSPNGLVYLVTVSARVEVRRPAEITKKL